MQAYQDYYALVARAVTERKATQAAPTAIGAPQGAIVDVARLNAAIGATPGSGEQAAFEAVRRLPQSTFNPGLYGDMSVLPVTFAAAGDVLALPRPKATRIYLIISNTLVGVPITVNFDTVADAVNGLPIPAGGNYEFLNAVPQNDLHIYAPLGGVILVGFINRSLPNAAASE